MEADAALTIYEELYYESQKKIALQYIVSDDDYSMRALLKHGINHPKGKLKPEIPEPEWLADPSHSPSICEIFCSRQLQPMTCERIYSASRSISFWLSRCSILKEISGL